MGSSVPSGSTAGGVTADKPFVASMGIYVFSREVLLEMLERAGHRFRQGDHPAGARQSPRAPYIYRGYWADVGTIDAFYDANIQLTRRGAPFNFFHPRLPIYTHPRFLPATRTYACRHRRVDRGRGLLSRPLRSRRSVVGIRTHIERGAKVTRSILLGADDYEEETAAATSPLGIGRDVVLDRVIVDKNARIGDGVRLVNDGERPGGGRRWVLHPQRHHHRAQGCGGEGRDGCLACRC